MLLSGERIGSDDDNPVPVEYIKSTNLHITKIYYSALLRKGFKKNLTFVTFGGGGGKFGAGHLSNKGRNPKRSLKIAF